MSPSGSVEAHKIRSEVQHVVLLVSTGCFAAKFWPSFATSAKPTSMKKVFFMETKTTIDENLRAKFNPKCSPLIMCLSSSDVTGNVGYSSSDL